MTPDTTNNSETLRQIAINATVAIVGKSGVHVVTNVSPSETEVDFCIEGTDFEWFRVQVSTLVASPPPPPATLGKAKAASRAA
jgi:hypothetical protein